MFGIFKKIKECSVCGANSDTTKIIGFDPTNRGEFKESEVGKPEDLCINCFKEKWENALEKYAGTAICFLPLQKHNSYSCVPLERAKEWALEDEEIRILNDIINKYSGDKKCNKCHGRGNFLFFNYPYDSEKIYASSENKEEPAFFCGKCFSQRIIQEIDSQNLSIDEINIPFQARELYMHGEC